MKAEPIQPLLKATLIFIAASVLTGGIELWMGRSLFGPDGRFGLWESNIWSNENSQRLADPYSFSHIIHGMLFYAVLWLLARKAPVRFRPSPPAFLLGFVRKIAEKMPSFSESFSSRTRRPESETNPATTR